MSTNTKDYQRKYIQSWRQRHKEQGLCQMCNEPALPNSILCETHHQTRSENEKKNRLQRREYRRDNGLCVRCGQPALQSMIDNSSSYPLCENHYLESVSNRRLGTSKHWRFLKKLLEKQNYKCSYTGDQIILGHNDSIDHIFPVYHYSHLKDDLNNLEWVTREVNEMKRDRSPDEFLSLISRILKFRATP